MLTALQNSTGLGAVSRNGTRYPTASLFSRAGVARQKQDYCIGLSNAKHISYQDLEKIEHGIFHM